MPFFVLPKIPFCSVKRLRFDLDHLYRIQVFQLWIDLFWWFFVFRKKRKHIYKCHKISKQMHSIRREKRLLQIVALNLKCTRKHFLARKLYFLDTFFLITKMMEFRFAQNHGPNGILDCIKASMCSFRIDGNQCVRCTNATQKWHDFYSKIYLFICPSIHNGIKSNYIYINIRNWSPMLNVSNVITVCVCVYVYRWCAQYLCGKMRTYVWTKLITATFKAYYFYFT